MVLLNLNHGSNHRCGGLRGSLPITMEEEPSSRADHHTFDDPLHRSPAEHGTQRRRICQTFRVSKTPNDLS